MKQSYNWTDIGSGTTLLIVQGTINAFREECKSSTTYLHVEGCVLLLAHLIFVHSLNSLVMSYYTIYYALEDAFLTMLLWRGHSTFSLPVPSVSTRSVTWVSVGFPLHSLTAFLCTTRLVENPDLLPSFFFVCIGW